MSPENSSSSTRQQNEHVQRQHGNDDDDDGNDEDDGPPATRRVQTLRDDTLVIRILVLGPSPRPPPKIFVLPWFLRGEFRRIHAGCSTQNCGRPLAARGVRGLCRREAHQRHSLIFDQSAEKCSCAARRKMLAKLVPAGRGAGQNQEHILEQCSHNQCSSDFWASGGDFDQNWPKRAIFGRNRSILARFGQNMGRTLRPEITPRMPLPAIFEHFRATPDARRLSIFQHIRTCLKRAGLVGFRQHSLGPRPAVLAHLIRGVGDMLWALSLVRTATQRRNGVA